MFSDDGSGRLSFKNFLELFSVFSPRANFDIKVIFLFAIWDFDGARCCTAHIVQVTLEVALTVLTRPAQSSCSKQWTKSTDSMQ